MFRRLLLSLILGTASGASALTPDELKAQLEERSSSLTSFQEILADPNPQRARAAMEIMLDSNDEQLIDIAIDAGLRSTDLETRQTALQAFLQTRPSLIVSLQVPTNSDEDFEEYFRRYSRGTFMSDGSATYTVNIGAFSEELNCFLHTGFDWCTAQITPDGLVVRTRLVGNGTVGWVRSNLFFSEGGQLTGATAIDRVEGAFESELTIAN